MIVYLVNGVSGKIVHKYTEKNVRFDLPLNIVLSEHIVVVAFHR